MHPMVEPAELLPQTEGPRDTRCGFLGGDGSQSLQEKIDTIHLWNVRHCRAGMELIASQRGAHYFFSD